MFKEFANTSKGVLRQNSIRNEESGNLAALPVGEKYMIMEAPGKIVGFRPTTGLRRSPCASQLGGRPIPLVCWSSIIRQPGRSDGASRPGALETRLYLDPWTELCPVPRQNSVRL